MLQHLLTIFIAFSARNCQTGRDIRVSAREFTGHTSSHRKGKGAGREMFVPIILSFQFLNLFCTGSMLKICNALNAGSKHYMPFFPSHLGVWGPWTSFEPYQSR